MNEARYEIRIDTDLKAAYLAAAKRNDRDGAQLIRDFIRQYVRENAQGSLLPKAGRKDK